MSDGSSRANEERYMNWLSTQIGPAQLSEIYDIYKKIEDYCLRHKLIKNSLFEKLDYQTTKMIKDFIDNDKSFRIQHKRYMARYMSALTFLVRYSKMNEDSIIQRNPTYQTNSKSQIDQNVIDKRGKDFVSDSHSDISQKIKAVLKEECRNNQFGTTITFIQGRIKDSNTGEIQKILVQAPWAEYINGRWSYVSVDPLPKEKIEQDIELPVEKSVNFSNPENMAFTTPTFLSYFEYEYTDLKSWTNLYVKLVKSLYEDYDHLFKVGMSFNGYNYNRTDFGDYSSSLKMIAPKPIHTGNGRTFYIETNLSATNILGKIKSLLDLCLVDYENVRIKYVTNKKIKNEKPQKDENVKDGAFVSWMMKNGLSKSTAYVYLAAVSRAEKFAQDNNFKHQSIIAQDFVEANETAKELFANSRFGALNESRGNWYFTAINKYLKYLSSGRGDSPVFPTTTSNKPKSSINLYPYERVLSERFSKGYIKGIISLKKFKTYFEEINGKTLDIPDNEIEANISQCCISYGKKLYLPSTILPDELRNELFEYIRSQFQTGKTVIYYEALFNAFEDKFLDYNLIDEIMLKEYLRYYNNNEFFLQSTYLSKSANVRLNTADELKSILLEAGIPIQLEKIFEMLPHIPEQKIRQTIYFNQEFINNGKSYYFHVDSVHIMDEELKGIESLIEAEIHEKNFLTGNELMDILKAKFPDVIENNVEISYIGLRDTLKYYLKDRFSFNSNIISRRDNTMTASEIIANFAESKTEFDISELQNLAEELNAGYYVDIACSNALRVSKNRFVSKNQAVFQVEVTDNAIDRYCFGKYIPIGKVSEFGTFPDAGFPWNSFLLEAYVYKYSKKYQLIHSTSNRTVCVGAIVKRSSEINTFDELAIDALSESDIELTKSNALEFLVEQGYLARRSYANIEEVLIQAKALRNKKGKD